MSNRYRRQGHSTHDGGLANVPGTGEVLAAGTTVPSAGAKGYAKGCLWVKTDASSNWWYQNQGSRTSANFQVFSSATALTVTPNTAAAFTISDGTTTLLNIDTRNTVTGVSAFLFTASPPTIASAGGDTFSQVKVAAVTVTLTGVTGVTAMDGLGLYIGVPTVTDTMACTVTTVSNLYVALPVVGGMITFTNTFAAHFAGAIKVDGNIDASAGASNDILKANTAAAGAITDGTTSYYTVDTRNTVTGVTANLFGASAPTIASSGGDTYSEVGIGALTVTITGVTGITALAGLSLKIGSPTITDTMACTVTTASAVIINGPVPAGMITCTNTFALDIPTYVTNGTTAAGLRVAAPSGAGTNQGIQVVSGGITITAGGLNLAAVGQTVTIIANTTAALLVSDATTNILAVDTRNTVTAVSTLTVTSPASLTIAGAAGSTHSLVTLAALTITTSTATTITALDGLIFNCLAPTINQSGGAVTVTTASAAFFSVPVAGASVTITNNKIINTNVAGCFCTAGGVWTSVSGRASKRDIKALDLDSIPAVIDKMDVVTFRKLDHHSEGDFVRYGVIAEDAPDCMAMPERTGIGAIYMAGFALAAIKYLKARVDELEGKKHHKK